MAGQNRDRWFCPRTLSIPVRLPAIVYNWYNWFTRTADRSLPGQRPVMVLKNRWNLGESRSSPDVEEVVRVFCRAAAIA